jgi:hypothetical protein
MRAKSVNLYSIPYVVSVASFLIVAQEVAPTLNSIGLRDTNTKNEIFSGQSVNRSLKRDRLPIQSATPHQTPAKGQKKAPLDKKTAEIIIVQSDCQSAPLA